MKSARRTLCGAAACAALHPLLAFGQAEPGFPSRPVTLLCPWPPGGPLDGLLRVLAENASRHLNQVSVVIDNKPGAAGTMAAGILAGARPNGYTLAQNTDSVFRQPFITKTGYDPASDFTYVIAVASAVLGLVVNADSPFRTFAEFIEHGQRNPGTVSFGSYGHGSLAHVVMDQVASRHGIRWTHVPFRGTANNLAALQGGHITAAADAGGWAPFVDSGRFRLLAVFGKERIQRWPSVPTLRELGHDIAESSPWGIIGPRGLEPAHARVLHDAFKAASESPAFVQACRAVAQEPTYMSGEQYRQYALAQLPVQKAVVERYGLDKQ